MKSDCNYDKIKLIQTLAGLKNFINKHAIADAEKDNHPACAKMYTEIASEIDDMLTKLKQAVTGLAKEDKFE